jgi:hypothetical protein
MLTQLTIDAAGLVQLVVENVLVVGEGDDELDHEFAVARDDRSAGAPVGVLPSDSVVLLVHADHVGMGFGLAVGTDGSGVEVLIFGQR